MSRHVRTQSSYSSAEEYTKNMPIHIGLFGTNGVGKTTFAGTTGLRTLLLDCSDAGAVTLRKANPKNLKIYRIPSAIGYLDVMDEVNQMADSIDLLVVDTLSGLQSLCIREVKGKKKFEMNQNKWGLVSSRLIECIAETRNFPKDVIYLMQKKKKSGGEDAMDSIMPALTPSVTGYLSSNVDWVGYLAVDEEGRRTLDFRLTDTLEVKDRAGLFPKLLVNPNYLGIRKRILTALGENSNG